MCSFGRWTIFGYWSLLIGLSVQQLHGQGVEVSGKILMRASEQSAGKKHQQPPASEDVVVWLSPVKPGAIPFVKPAHQTSYRLVQKNKMFTPHLLVVPTEIGRAHV